MALVVNNIVTMEWQTANFFKTSKGAFIWASKEYDTEKGKVTVFFNCNTAFIFRTPEDADDAEDIWDTKELKEFLKKNMDGSFPLQYEEYLPLITWGNSKVDAEVAEQYGLTEFISDIEARLKDVEPFGDEKDKPCV